MIDAILHVTDFTTLVGHLNEHHPEMLERDEEGELAMPPVVTGFARTPAAIGPDGNSLMVYARLREDEVEAWRDMPHVEVLGEAPYTGQGTGATVYGQVFDDPAKDTKYRAVYDYSPRQEDDGEGGLIAVEPPKMFGLLAGA